MQINPVTVHHKIILKITRKVFTRGRTEHFSDTFAPVTHAEPIDCSTRPLKTSVRRLTTSGVETDRAYFYILGAGTGSVRRNSPPKARETLIILLYGSCFEHFTSQL